MMVRLQKSLSLALLLVALVLPGRSAWADEYAKTNLSNFMKTMIRFGALDIRRDDVIDLYARTTDCRTYEERYRNDFEWEKIRKKLRQSIRENVATFPVSYKYDATLQLDRYDFKAGVYRFLEKTAKASSNVFSVAVHAEEFCLDGRNTLLPYVYKMVLDQPVKIVGLPLSEEEGRLLLERMVAGNNADRLVFTRFNIRVLYIAPVAAMSKEEREKNGDTLRVTQEVNSDHVKFDAKLDSIEYFEDEARTKLIYSYRP